MADYCYVTSDAVQNWIRSGILAAQRTAGGQYRVRIDDLRQFMIEREMSVEELDQELREDRPEYCWQYHRKRVRRHAGAANSCDRCVAKSSMALKCYELREHVDHRRVYCKSDCSDCGYYKKYGESTE